METVDWSAPLLVELLEAASPGIVVWLPSEAGFVVVAANSSARAIMGEALVGSTSEAFDWLPGLGRNLTNCWSTDQRRAALAPHDEKHLEVSFARCGESVVMQVRDLAPDRLDAQAERYQAVGRFADRVAHDFNNLLTIVNSYSELLLDELAGDERAAHFLSEVLAAGQRAAALTSALLSFTRRQTLAPEAISPNVVVQTLEPLLQRVLEREVELQIRLDQDLGVTSISPRELERLILRHALNARDAMNRTGTLVISTENASVVGDEPWVGATPMPAGRYIVISVAALGAVGESADHVGSQEPGVFERLTRDALGTRTRLYLHRTDDESPSERPAEIALADLSGSETILVAEDEHALRGLLERVLTRAGYTVVTAVDGAHALSLPAAGDVDLLVTDVVMPRMGGRKLAERLVEQHRDLKILYISGYAANDVAHHGVADAPHFLEKPFSARELLLKVRKVLDGE